jgi:hypothetical protein
MNYKAEDFIVNDFGYFEFFHRKTHVWGIKKTFVAGYFEVKSVNQEGIELTDGQIKPLLVPYDMIKDFEKTYRI